MGTCICGCGATYHFAEIASGRRAKCKHCGESLILSAGTGAEAEPDAPNPRVAAASAPSDTPMPVIEVEYEVEEEESALPSLSRAERGYWGALFWSLLFPSSIHNLAAFLTLWLIYGFIDLMPLRQLGIFGFIFWIALCLWYVAFRVAAVEAGANGQFQLPSVEISSNLLVDLLEPAVRWYGSWLVVLLPAIAYSIFRASLDVKVVIGIWQAIMSPALPGAGGPSIDPVLITLLVTGLFFWPMVALVVIIGGFGYLWRVDQIVISVGRSLWPYLVTVVVVASAYVLYAVSEAYLSPSLWSVWQSPTFAALGTAILQHVLATGIELYVGIVAARAIGLYFRHFGHRFAWDWGQQD